MRLASSGSSPLARGTSPSRFLYGACRRLIPARAGNIPSTRSASLSASAHPRSRGEHRAVSTSISSRGGSSPLARGTSLLKLLATLYNRLIPARAGNICPGRRSPPLLPAHPRSRGEHKSSPNLPPRPLGSSPLARGTFLGVFSVIIGFRLIPARAGNITYLVKRNDDYAAHPRSRGEHATIQWRDGAGLGSSPLARGTFALAILAGKCRRLIPARAGNICPRRASVAATSAHPRSRGEHRKTRSGEWGTPGSSPLARGTCISVARARPPARLIPARAGNIGRYPPARTCRPAHPRSRGEHARSPPPACR